MKKLLLFLLLPLVTLAEPVSLTVFTGNHDVKRVAEGDPDETTFLNLTANLLSLPTNDVTLRMIINDPEGEEARIVVDGQSQIHFVSPCFLNQNDNTLPGIECTTTFPASIFTCETIIQFEHTGQSSTRYTVQSVKLEYESGTSCVNSPPESPPDISTPWGTTYDYTTIYGFTGEDITLEWDAALGATEYVVELEHFQRNEIVFTINTTSLSTIFVLPRTGHYIARVKALNANGESQWAVSTDPTYGVVNNIAQAWWIYGFVAPPGPIIIE
jgi:hypothetical protein